MDLHLRGPQRLRMSTDGSMGQPSASGGPGGQNPGVTTDPPSWEDWMKMVERQARSYGFPWPPPAGLAPPSLAPQSVGGVPSATDMSQRLTQFNQGSPSFAGSNLGIGNTQGVSNTLAAGSNLRLNLQAQQTGMYAGLSASAPTTPVRSTFERVTGEIPIDKYEYGSAEANWSDWVLGFEKAVQVATNAANRDCLEQLCLQWLPLKLNDGAQPIYAKCEYKDKSWPSLRAELAERLDDPTVRRQWERSMDAYKKPASMQLQAYRAKIIGLVNQYSPGLVMDPKAYARELYYRFINGLEKSQKEYVEDALPYGEETLDNAFNAALKYEIKIERESVGSAAAVRFPASKEQQIKELQYEIDKLSARLDSMMPSSSSSESD